MLDLATLPWPFVFDDYLVAIVAIIFMTWQARSMLGLSLFMCLFVVLPFLLFSTYPSQT